MRQDHLDQMRDPRTRNDYLAADLLDKWAPKTTRQFAHSHTINDAWASLRHAIADRTTTERRNRFIDAAIAQHLTDKLPQFSSPESNPERWIALSEQGIDFGPSWSGNEIADLVATDFIPDTYLASTLQTAGQDGPTLESIAALADTLQDEEAAETDAWFLTRNDFPVEPITGPDHTGSGTQTSPNHNTKERRPGISY